ncbi:phage gp6-like head-tail connector protein [Salmonella enterica subsp. houtenae]|uniref:Phage gp6-like head-tail connector protein n=1 Tax=Salmonella enterica subsp. houtenae serovar 48:z4,z32:- TaxID=2577535 RepID=A0A729FV94_SALHO|nr:head-tail connector protein [Citrobacter freundii]EBQ8223274.1 phage gp6-like head-tail connector protein [Salmonella enterica]ECH9932354.1 phage gp6-like head-tail connector protein [Salmonella enterica subsp. houtenae]EKR1447096.1 phage gp6-like head-tail connector protein [Salmonella enterica subsp. houtenae serovar 48:z4,z32:-]ECZ5452050.1 phage gp6-like head-tail connector protein [Salmonella enterica subsp. houtenae]EDN2206341.1 phage gp6-like head-tail connector protein [Salmonella e
MSEMIEKLRAQCRIDADDTTEDEMLLLYYGAGMRKAENYINRKLYEGDVPDTDPDGLKIADDILLALMLLVGHWFNNREESSDVAKMSIPFGFTSLLEPYRFIPL